MRKETSPGFDRCAFVLRQLSGIRLICSEVRLRVFNNGEPGGTADQLEGGTERPTLSTFRNLQCSAWRPRISSKKPLGRRLRLDQALFWSLLRPVANSHPAKAVSISNGFCQAVSRAISGKRSRSFLMHQGWRRSLDAQRDGRLITADSCR